MTLQNLINSLGEDSLSFVAVLLLFLSLVQISPIKLNPWSFIAKHVGRALNGEVFKRIDTIEDEVKGLVNKVDEDRAITSRVRILRFNDELLSGVKHTKESFDQTLVDIDIYEKYCRLHPDFKNNKSVMSIKNIKTSYQKRLDKHDFLTNGED